MAFFRLPASTTLPSVIFLLLPRSSLLNFRADEVKNTRRTRARPPSPRTQPARASRFGGSRSPCRHRHHHHHHHQDGQGYTGPRPHRPARAPPAVPSPRARLHHHHHHHHPPGASRLFRRSWPSIAPPGLRFGPNAPGVGVPPSDACGLRSGPQSMLRRPGAPARPSPGPGARAVGAPTPNRARRSWPWTGPPPQPSVLAGFSRPTHPPSAPDYRRALARSQFRYQAQPVLDQHAHVFQPVQDQLAPMFQPVPRPFFPVPAFAPGALSLGPFLAAGPAGSPRPCSCV